MAVTMWELFEDALQHVLLGFPPRTYLIVAHRERPNDLFVQIAGIPQRGPDDMLTVETGAIRSTPDEQPSAELLQAGFEAHPTEWGGLWRRTIPWPVPSQTILDTVHACVAHIRDSTELTEFRYWSWRDPEPASPAIQIPGLRYAPDPGEKPVLFPSLGIDYLPE